MDFRRFFFHLRGDWGGGPGWSGFEWTELATFVPQGRHRKGECVQAHWVGEDASAMEGVARASDYPGISHLAPRSPCGQRVEAEV